MKFNSLQRIAVTTFFAILPTSSRLVAQVEHATRGLTRYFVQSLSTLGGTSSNGYGGVNNRGWVSGDANLAGDQTEHGVLWRNGAITDLGTLGGLNGSVSSPVKDDRGLIVGAAQTAEVDPLGEFWGAPYYCTSTSNCLGWQNLQRGFRWQNGVITALPLLGGNNNYAFGANNRGQIVGTSETSNFDPSCVPPQVLDFDAVIWGPKPGQIQTLPPLPGDSVAVALAINDNGVAVGGSGACQTPNFLLFAAHPVMWDHGTVTNLGSLGGVLFTAANAINNARQVVGQADLPGDTATHAFFWQNGVMTDIGTLPGDVTSIANDINSKGQVIGASCDANFNCRVFLWENGVMTDANDLIPPDSPLTLTWGSGINDRGEISGSAYDASAGTSPGFLAIPIHEEFANGESPSLASVGARRPRAVLPDSVREMLKQRLRRRGIGQAK